MNPIQILQNFLGKGGNVQQLLMQVISTTQNNNPMINNLMNMANSGNSQGIENFARNFFRDRGRDFDTEFNQFMSNFNKR